MGTKNEITATLSGKSKEYKNGYEAGVIGRNPTNNHHSNFATREGMKDWQDGYNVGRTQGCKGKSIKHNPRKK